MTGNKRILIIEDNESHAVLQKTALLECNAHVEISIARSAEEAERILTQANAFLPDAILLDSNLPGVSGLELLKKLRGGTLKMYVPIIMMTSSENPKDTKEAYRLGANSCLEKPGDYDELAEMMKKFTHMWFTWNKMPGRMF